MFADKTPHAAVAHIVSKQIAAASLRLLSRRESRDPPALALRAMFDRNVLCNDSQMHMSSEPAGANCADARRARIRSRPFDLASRAAWRRLS